MSNPEYIDNNEVCTIFKNEAKEIPVIKHKNIFCF